MNKTFLVIIIVAAFIFIGVFYIMNNETDDIPQDLSIDEFLQSSSNESQVDYEVSYTENGFEPSTLEVEVGSTVEFVNNSQRSMWIAAEGTSTSRALPEFNAGKGVGPGESYEFTFDTAGEWSYHEYLRPEVKGAIIVR